MFAPLRYHAMRTTIPLPHIVLAAVLVAVVSCATLPPEARRSRSDLLSPDPVLRASAANALTRDPARASMLVPELVGLLGDKNLMLVWPDGKVEFHPPGGWSWSGTHPGPETIGLAFLSARALQAVGGPAVPALLEALRHPDPLIRRRSAEVLGRIGDRSAVEALIAALADGDQGVRSAAAEALGSLGDRRALPALKEALQGDLPFDLTLLLPAAASFGDPAIAPLAAANVTHHDSRVRLAAIEILIRLQDPSAHGILLEALGDSCAGVAVAAAREFTARPDPRAVPRLVAALRSRDDRVRYYAAGALRACGAGVAAGEIIEAAARGNNDRYFDHFTEVLRALTGQEFGRDWMRWRVWWERVGKDLE